LSIEWKEKANLHEDSEDELEKKCRDPKFNFVKVDPDY